ncbi:hypothetical protein SDC9_181209 [bioreactor metagenome]|uniref:Major facilitator superfamily (MFS) profile domain-containing protein n=1 Tax=bioreactor metagenome TaxID=1076179 RepID=A0A645H3Y5_9ZZZZ
MFGGFLSDRIAIARPVFRLQLMGTSMLLGAPVIFLMGRVDALLAACVTMAAFGLFRGVYEANTHAALFEVIAPSNRASAVGVMTMLAFLAGSLSPWLMGRCREIFPQGQGLSTGFSVLSLAYVIGSLAVLAAVFFTFEKDRYREGTVIPEPPGTAKA